MAWRTVLKAVQALVAHCSLFCFTLLLVFKLDNLVSYSWWVIFFPLWAFHAVVARGRFSLPAPSVPHNRNWAPCHAVVATPLLIAFELLLCIYLESIYVHGFPALSLKIVFLPLLAFEMTILIDNFRMCRALIPGDDEGLNDEAIWETLPHFWVAISMVFFVAATIFTLLKLCGDVGALGWWDLFINFGIAECFAFLVCTKWSNPIIHRNSSNGEATSSSVIIRYLDWGSGLILSPLEDEQQDRICGLQDIGGHIMKVPIIGFQILLCMRLEGTPANAKYIPLPALFSPLFLLQGVGLLFSASMLVERIVLLRRSRSGTGLYFRFSSKANEFFEFFHRGSRLLGWWSIEEGNREELARLFHEATSGFLIFHGSAYIIVILSMIFGELLSGERQISRTYNTFSGYPPEIVKKMTKKDLAEEVWRLQAALGEQTEITKHSCQEYEKLHTEKVLCRVCFEREISVVLLPCRHRILCSMCSAKCQKCPVCRVSIEELLPVYDV